MSDPNVIQAAEPDKIQVSTRRVVIPKGGQISSDKLDDFVEQVVNDLITLQDQGNGNASAIKQYFGTLMLETANSRKLAYALEQDRKFERRAKAVEGSIISRWYDYHDASGVQFIEGSEQAKRAAVSTEYGHATLPMNAVESRTYALRLISQGTVTSASLSCVTSGVFDKLEGDGPTDYEFAGTVEETDPKNCANGNNAKYWRRRVIFDLESDVTEVEAEITIRVPDSANLYANVVYVHPFPMGSVDIVGVWASPDLTDAYVPIDTFTEVNGAMKKRWFIPSQKIGKLKVRIRQRNWFEENGKKVFEYGLQEAGIQLVEWDKTFDDTPSQLTDNHTFVTKLDADTGFGFWKLYGFYADPDFSLEPSGERHVHFVLARDADGTDVIWDSDATALPQLLQAPIDMGITGSVYLVTTLNWVADASPDSPFPAGTPPFLNGFGLRYKAAEV